MTAEKRQGPARRAAILGWALLALIACTERRPPATVEAQPVLDEEVSLQKARRNFGIGELTRARATIEALLEKEADPRIQGESLFLLSLIELAEGRSEAAKRVLDLLDGGDYPPDLTAGGRIITRLLVQDDERGQEADELRKRLDDLVAQVEIFEREDLRQLERAGQMGRSLQAANRRVAAQEQELEALRQEIRLLREIDTMLQQRGEGEPAGGGTQPPAADEGGEQGDEQGADPGRR